jgi:hypothetical protein
MYEQVRHECCVRQLIKYRYEMGLKEFRLYIVKTKFSQQVWDDFYEQFKLGNKGETKCWKKSLLVQQDLGI